MSITTQAGVALAVLLGNGFFVAAEFALISARRTNIELAALNGSRAARLTLQGMEQVSLLLAGAQLGITLCSLVFGAVGEPMVAHLLEHPLAQLGVSEHFVHPISFAIALTAMVYLHVFIGEMVPKNISLASSTKAALILVPPLLLLVRLSKPVVVMLNAIANRIVRLLGIKPRQEMRSSFNRDEVAGFVKESHREGLLSSEEEQLLSGSLDFDERHIRHSMLPLQKLIATSANPTRREVERLIKKHGYSRYPVLDMTDAAKTFKGYVHVKDILRVADDDIDKPLPKRLIRPLATIPSQTTLNAALTSMRSTSAHIVQVKGRGGQVEGVLMLEDVLEELVGTIRDETQQKPAHAVK